MNHSDLTRIFKFISLVIIFLSATFCERDLTDIPETYAYAVLEKSIRDKYDSYSVFTWAQYTRLLDTLSQSRFTVLPLNEMRNYFDNSRIVIGLRHDVDLNPFKALEMTIMERHYGIKATYFFLPTAEYYGKFNGSKLIRSNGIYNLLKEISRTGAEIGIHNDLISVMINWETDPYTFNKDELDFYKSSRIKIYGTSSHGSTIAKNTVPNYQIFSDFARYDSIQYNGKRYPMGIHSLSEFGFQYEAYYINYGIYFSDAGGKWNDKGGFEGVLRRLSLCKPGDRIQILVHPDWWGKKIN